MEIYSFTQRRSLLLSNLVFEIQTKSLFLSQKRWGGLSFGFWKGNGDSSGARRKEWGYVVLLSNRRECKVVRSQRAARVPPFLMSGWFEKADSDLSVSSFHPSEDLWKTTTGRDFGKLVDVCLTDPPLPDSRLKSKLRGEKNDARWFCTRDPYCSRGDYYLLRNSGIDGIATALWLSMEVLTGHTERRTAKAQTFCQIHSWKLAIFIVI